MTHHAYLYEGSQAQLGALVEDARERFGFTKEHSPDVHIRSFEKFGIDESRWLADVGALKSASGRALFVVGIASITSEAQQALLKLFEEPQQGSMYVLLVPHGTLLPTLRSRTLEYPQMPAPARLGSSQREPGQASAFLKASGKERSDFIAKLLKDDEGQKERARDFVNALEAELHKKTTSAKVREGLSDIAKVRDYLRDRSPSLKMLLEHLAISLPVF
jgi:DNA polymerase III delta subunit-like protein